MSKQPISVRIRLFRSSVSKFTETVVSLLSSLLVMPFMINNLGTDSYGMWILALSILGWFNLLTIGLPAAVQRSLVMFIATHEHEKVNGTFSCGLALFVGLGVVAALSLIALSFNTGILDVTNEEMFSHVLMILSIKVLWDFAMKAFFGFFSAMLRFDIDSNLQSLTEIIKSILIVLLIKKINLYGVVAAVMIADVFLRSMQIYYARKLFPQISFKWSYVRMEEIARLFHFSKHLIAGSIARVVYTQSNPIIISKLFGLHSVALFSVPQRLCVHVAGFTQSVMSVFFPLFSQKHAKNDDVREFFKNVVIINLFVTSMFNLPLLVMCSTFILLWVGPEFVEAYPIIFFLVFTSLCAGMSKPIQDLLFSQANHKLFTVVNVVGSISNISLAITFSKQFGLVGVAAGTAASFLFVDVGLYLYLLKRYNDIPVLPFYRKFWIAALVLFGFGITLNIAVGRLQIHDWTTFIFMAAGMCLLSVVVNWFLLLNKQLRTLLGNLVLSQVKSFFSRQGAAQ